MIRPHGPLASAAFAMGLVVGLSACGTAEPLPPPEPEDPPMHPAWRRARVLVTDAEAPTLHVYDVEFESLVDPVTLPERAEALVIGDGGEHLLVRGATSVSPLYAGVSILDHSEGATDSDTPHVHVYKYPPTLVDVDLSGSGAPVVGAPVVGALGHELAVGYPTPEGLSLRRFEDRALLDPETFVAEAALFTEMQTVPSAIAPIPGGFAIVESGAVTLTNELEPVAACVDGFGPLASAGPRLVFGCADGVVSVSSTDSTVTLAGASGRRPTSAALHVDRAEVVIADGSSTLVRFDSATAEPLEALEIAADACDVLFEPGHGEELLTLSADGALRTLDAETGAELAIAELTSPFECAADVRPRLAAIPARAYVLLPETRELVELWIDADLRELTRTTLPGSPRLLRTAGFDLETRNLGDLSDVE
jgi:hypothetical protein